MKYSYARATELKRQGVDGQTAVKRLCAEFSESFFMVKNRLMEEYKDSRGMLQQRCIGNF